MKVAAYFISPLHGASQRCMIARVAQTFGIIFASLSLLISPTNPSHKGVSND
jgi:hypothetical protein